MRSPFASESEAFRFVVLLVLALVPVALAVAFGPTWLAIAVPSILVAALALYAFQLRMRQVRGLELPLKMAPPHVGPADERRYLVVANETLGEDGLLAEIERLASMPGTHVLLLAPSVISTAARLTGAVDGPSKEAGARITAALDRIGTDRGVRGLVSEDPPIEAVEDAFATFSPDEVIVSTRWGEGASGLEPQLAGQVRERFAVPVRHLVFDPGSAAREPGRVAEARYRRQHGSAAAARFGLRTLAGAGILAAIVISVVALAKSNEHKEARAATQEAAQIAASLPVVAQTVSLTVSPEWKKGPEGEKHDAYTVTEFTLRAGQPQYLRIDNTDTVPHSITSPGAGVNIIVMPGVHTYKLMVKQPGRYIWFCTFICDEWAMQHAGYMSGFITVA